MPKSIKVSEIVYRKLLTIQRPRETFSQVVERLIGNSEAMVIFIRTMEADTEHLKHRAAPIEQQSPVD